MGGPYNIPRSYKGEGKILYIFSMKAFLYTIGGAMIGTLLYFLFRMIGLGTVGLVLIVLLAAMGFAIGTFKIPENTKMEFTKRVGGEAIDAIIIRWFKFKQNKNRIYVYKEEDSKDDK